MNRKSRPKKNLVNQKKSTSGDVEKLKQTNQQLEERIAE